MSLSSRLQRIDLHSLRLFAALAQDGSITRSAERAHIAASALSRRMSDLEHAIGAALLERSRKGVILTAVGRVVLQYAERIQDELHCLLEDAVSVQDAQSTVRVFASRSVASGVLPDLLRGFRPSAEHVRLEIVEASSREVRSACSAGTADIGIGLGERSAPPDGLECWQLWTDRLQVLMPQDHLLARSPALRFEQVLAFPVIGTNAAGVLFDRLRREAHALGLAFHAQVTATSFAASCRLAEFGLGVAILPDVAVPARLSSPLIRKPLQESWACQPINLYRGTRRTRSPAVAALIQHLRRQAQVVSLLRQQAEAAEPTARFEPQFAIPALLPVEAGLHVCAGGGLVGPAKLHEP